MISSMKMMTKDTKISEILIENENKIKIKPYIQVFDENEKNIYRTDKENETLSELRKQIKKNKRRRFCISEFIYGKNR